MRPSDRGFDRKLIFQSVWKEVKVGVSWRQKIGMIWLHG